MIPAIMKAIRIHGRGDSSVLLYEDAPVPSILPDEVLRQKVKIDKNEKGLPTAILLFCDPAGIRKIWYKLLQINHSR